MNTLIIFNALVLTLLAWASLFKIVPACATSSFRYRLWRIRDEVCDEVAAGEYRDPEQAQALVRLLEASIENADDLSALNVWMLHVASRGKTPPDIFHLDDLVAMDKERLRQHLDRFEVALVKKALGGTPSGWVALVALVSMAIASSLAKRIRGGPPPGSLVADAKGYVRQEFEIEPAVAMIKSPAERRRRRPMHQHV